MCWRWIKQLISCVGGGSAAESPTQGPQQGDHVDGTSSERGGGNDHCKCGWDSQGVEANMKTIALDIPRRATKQKMVVIQHIRNISDQIHP